MKQFKNYKETQVISSRPKIPAGGYEAVIKTAEVKEYSGKNGSYEMLEISFDITSGEYKDYYANDYRSQQSEDKRWKGVLRLNIPTDDGSDSDVWSKRKFKTNITSVEESNPGYNWDWDERKLEGKKVGVLLQNKEWDFNGKTGWTAQPYGFIDIQKIKDGDFTVPKDKPLQQSQQAQQADSSSKSDFIEIKDDDLPF